MQWKSNMIRKRKLAVTVLTVFLIVSATACRKKAPSVAAPVLPKIEVPAPPKPGPPTIMEFVAEPNSIERGHYALLRWLVTDAIEITIQPEFGTVPAAGRQRISPGETTKYTLKAKGPGGETTAFTTITVTAPPPIPTTEPAAVLTLAERIAKEVEDVYFDFDRSEIRSNALAALNRNATAMKKILDEFPKGSFILEGHCDERGSAEYNIGLGDQRAAAAKGFLSNVGVPAERLLIVSYGKERPQCTEPTDDCWQKNRRVHFVAGETETND